MWDIQAYRLSILLILIFIVKMPAQNLISDGGFEEITCPDNPINSISDEDPWYTTGADAYWLQVNCPYDPVASESVVALRDDIPYKGFAHISLESALSFSGFFISEGMTTALIEQLESGRFYYFDMAYMNYEGAISRDFDIDECDPLPNRAMHVLFGSERIFLQTETEQTLDGFIIRDIVTNGRKTLTVDRPLEDNFRFNQWDVFWDCFEAQGDEDHIAMVGEYGKVEPPINCYDPDAAGLVYFTGHALDEVRLVQIPEEIGTSYSICSGISIEIDLSNLANGPYADKATYLWEDGSDSPFMTLREAGAYEAQMILPCVTVPFYITIEEVDCTADVFVANIFSPNGDGQNDQLSPSLATELQIISYSFSIYDRWGARVYHTSDMKEAWDGTVQGVSSGSGVYVWSLSYQLEGSDDTLYESGEVLKL